MHLCPICNNSKIIDVITINNVPVHCNLLWSSRSEAVSVPRGDILLAFCPTCGHLFNRAFEPEKMAYEQDYENSLHFSPHFQAYAFSLAEGLVERYGLKGKDIIEIGSGQGDFLRMLCKYGTNRGVGFDPSLAVHVDGSAVDPIKFVRDYYSEKYAEYPADFICSRHVLEHIERPIEFLKMLQRVIGDRHHIIVFFEVPNARYTLQELGIWDLIYEHFSYFTIQSLETAFVRSGFQILAIGETFNGQFLTVESIPMKDQSLPRQVELGLINAYVRNFADAYCQKVQTWKERLAQFSETGKRAVIWGAGSKGVSFLNILPTQDCIEYVVDINPRKEGKFVAGAGQEIVSPQALQRHPPEVVIVMNANYEEEIRSQIRELGISADIMLG